MNEATVLIVDAGSTQSTWCMLSKTRKTVFHAQGMSPYFLSSEQFQNLLDEEIMPKVTRSRRKPEVLYYYGTGCGNKHLAQMISHALKRSFPDCRIQVNHDLYGAARALCGSTKGIACILGTGSNSCYFDGKTIRHNVPGLGYVLGDEGSGAYLGRKVLQYYLYDIFDPDLKRSFESIYHTDASQILERVYKQPLPNRYLASFAPFLSEHRGHFMIENIIEDGLYDFFFQHISRYAESWKYPLHFVGGVAWAFRDVLKTLCHSYEYELGTVLKTPMQGLIRYHRSLL